MSSPPRQRTQRSSASATPRRATRNSAVPSSPAPMGADDQLQTEASQASSRGLLATPSGSRLQADSTQSQSPLFFRSSPVAESADDANGAAESDGGATPRASAMNIGGMKGYCTSRIAIDICRLFANPLCFQLQPRPRPQCTEHGPSKQQQRSFRSRIRVSCPP